MTIALAESLNVPVPVELLRPIVTGDIGRQDSQELKDAGAMNRAATSPTANPLQPSQLLGMTPIPASLGDLSVRGEAGADQSAVGAINRPLRETPSGLEGVLFSKPDTGAPGGVLAPPSGEVAPEGIRQPARQRRKLYIVLAALLVVVVVGSGLVYALLVPKGGTGAPPVNAVTGNVRFLSSGNTAPAGSIDEVQVSMQHIPNAPAGQHYYAWLQSGSEGALPIHWELLPQNGSLTSSYPNPQHNNVLSNHPYLFLITVETADNGTPSFDPNARLYYAKLQYPISTSTSFTIQRCPQGGSNNVCFS